MKILIACEFSGIVREEFKKLGHVAISCDLLETEIPGLHIKGDVLKILNMGWDMMIAFPPCTHLSSSGARWFEKKKKEQNYAIEFVKKLWTANIKYISIENPIGVLSTKFRKPSQIIQPWQYGHGETKATCLWLKNLPKLIPTNMVDGRYPRVHRIPPGENRWKERSKTYKGIAEAMAQQWGNGLEYQQQII